MAEKKWLTGLSLLTVLGLTLTACGNDEGDEADPDDNNVTDAEESSAEETTEEEDEGPSLPAAEAGLVYEDISQNVTVTDTHRPGDLGEVVVPGGVLTVESVETIESVAAEEIGEAVEEPEEGAPGGAPEEFRAADGEVFRILTLSYEVDEDAGHHTAASLALNVGGAQNHLQDLEMNNEYRILFSVPEDGGADLVISSDGHDQTVDVLTGERDEDDEVAAGYYRQITNQDVNHTFRIDDSIIATVDHRGRTSDDYVVDYDFHVSSVRLAAWSEEGGWANDGEAWLIIEWRYEVSADGPAIFQAVHEVDVTLTAESGDESYEENYYDDAGHVSSGDEHVTSIAVPLDTVDVALSFSGSAVAELGGSYELAGGDSVSFASDTLEVSFPDERYGSDEDEVDEAEEDADGEDAEGESSEADEDTEDEA
ncbi:hypothetical protein [Nesterenkonia flava]|uniref:Uncharacterized protein n=1 Tax=Nesterenkonia flava TaxID=469799 RepID=A0ABU1FT78_9MICC|nr:hypothetical protein [Nesterenkonia flava]MDR5711844.1 hypothetical protein [Nesterenkonia flava]